MDRRDKLPHPRRAFWIRLPPAAVHALPRVRIRPNMSPEKPAPTCGCDIHSTVLVREVYLRLIDAGQVDLKSRAHFFSVSASLMRRILVEFARARRSQKRGGGAQKVSLDESALFSPEPSEDLITLDAALDALAAFDQRKAKVVELRFVGGMTEEETAEALEIHPTRYCGTGNRPSSGCGAR